MLDPSITYFNSTPVGTVFYALDVVAPVLVSVGERYIAQDAERTARATPFSLSSFFKNKTVDLVVSGTNEGSNLGPLGMSDSIPPLSLVRDLVN